MNTQTTIVHVAPYYPPHLGGLERVAKMAAEGLAARGHAVTVLTSDIDLPTNIREQAAPRVVPLKTFEFAHVPFSPGLFPRLMRIPKNSIIHLHLAQASYPERVWFAAKLRRIPYVVHFHLDVQPSGTFGWLFVIYKKLAWGRVLRGAARIITCSQAQADFIVKKYGIPADRIDVIPNAVSDTFFIPRPYTPKEGPLELLFVGRLAKQKRADRIIDAMKLLKVPARLTIVGDGEDREALEARAAGMDNISFAGFQNDRGIVSYLEKSDIFLISSENEGGTPLVVLEAMAAALPIVGSDVSGIHEFVDGTGILVGEPFPETFTHAIEALTKDPAVRAELSAKSANKAKQYTWAHFIDRLEQTYRAIK